MGETSIEWTATPRADGSVAPGYTFNPWWGCEKVSPGCAHCYAETFAKRVGQPVWGRQSERRFFEEKHWREPFKWNLEANKKGERRRVFCASMADVFEDRRDLDHWRGRLWELIRGTPHLDWLLLTKRPENIERMLDMHEVGARDNVWLGTTLENQEQAELRIGQLVRNYAPVHFLSCEPLLGPIDLGRWLRTRMAVIQHDGVGEKPAIDWIIAGGESGPGSRPCDLAWIRGLVDQCAVTDTAIFVKQLGARPVAYPVREHEVKGGPLDGQLFTSQVVYDPDVQPEQLRLNDRKGGDMSEWPEDLRVREFPREAVRTC